MRFTTQERDIIKKWVSTKIQVCPYCKCSTFTFTTVPSIIKNTEDNDLSLLSIKCDYCANVSFFNLYDILGYEWANNIEKENNIKQW